MELILSLLLILSNFPNFSITREINIGPVNKVVFDDLNKDGTPDIIVSNNQGVSIFQNTNHKLFMSIPSWSLSVPNVSDFLVYDINGDGLDDIILLVNKNRIKVYKNAGIEGFSPTFSHTLISNNFSTISVIDFNRDGMLDIYVSNPEDGDVVFLNEGGFEFVPMAINFLSSQLIPIKSQAGLVTYILQSPSRAKVLGKEKGMPAQVFSTYQFDSLRKVETFDMNNDGEMDYLFLTGAGEFSIYDDTFRFTVANVRDFAVEDYDMDSYLDIAMLLNDNSLVIYKNRGEYSFELNNYLSLSDEVGQAAKLWAVDLNSDNTPDLVFYNQNQLDIAINQSEGCNFIKVKLFPISASWCSMLKMYTDVGIATRIFKGRTVRFGAPDKIDSLEICWPDSGITVVYNLKVDTTYKFSMVERTETSQESISDTGLVKLYPNPTNALVSLEYDVKNPCFVKIELINPGGQTLYLIDSGYKDAGTHRLLFNTEDLKLGTYFIRALVGKKSILKKLIVLK